MSRIEELELDARRAQLASDVRSLVDKYRSIFGWDVPDIDEASADRLIIQALHQALDAVQAAPAPRARP